MKEKIAKLIDLKSIVTLTFVGVTGFAFIKSGGVVTSEQFIPLVTMILTFYFAKKDKDKSESEGE